MTGNVEMVIDIADGRVIQKFRQPMDYVAFDPPNAVQIAEAIKTAAEKIDPTLKPSILLATPADILERHRDTLAQRFAVMLNSMREQKRISNGKLALEMAEVALRVVK